jgi:DNA-directed RNA polymerase subunit E'
MLSCRLLSRPSEGAALYKLIPREETVRIPPDRLGEDLNVVAVELAQRFFEGRLDEEDNLTVLAKDVQIVGPGRIVHGDGAVYQKVTFVALAFKPDLNEIVEGKVVEILRFGAFVRFGPFDGLLHISQVMDDRIDIDEQNQRLVGKDTRRFLRVGDRVRARIVTVSMNELNYRESKIGLTMRQVGLGKIEWLDEDRKLKQEGGADAPRREARRPAPPVGPAKAPAAAPPSE